MPVNKFSVTSGAMYSRLPTGVRRVGVLVSILVGSLQRSKSHSLTGAGEWACTQDKVR